MIWVSHCLWHFSYENRHPNWQVQPDTHRQNGTLMFRTCSAMHLLKDSLFIFFCRCLIRPFSLYKTIMQPNLRSDRYAQQFYLLAPMQQAHETWCRGMQPWHTLPHDTNCTSCKLVAIGAMIVKQYWCHWQLWRKVTVKHTWFSYVWHL